MCKSENYGLDLLPEHPPGCDCDLCFGLVEPERPERRLDRRFGITEISRMVDDLLWLYSPEWDREQANRKWRERHGI